MTRKSGDRPLEELERRFEALRDQIEALPEASRPGLETALHEVSQAIAALGADREAGESPAAEAPDCPGAADSPALADAMLRHVFSAIPDMLTVIDRDFNIIMSNWHESAMVPEEARQGRPKCHRVFHHRDRPCKNCHVQKVFVTGQPQKTEKLNLLDGKTWEFSAFPVLSESGQVILAAEHVRDVTGRHQAAKALKESEERFRAIFAAAQDAIFIKDRSLRYIQVNPAMETLFDRPAADLTGKSDKDLFRPADAAQIQAEDRRVLSGEVVIAVNTRLVRGESKTFHVVKVPLHDDAGKIIGVCGIARDITDLKQAEAALRESEEKYRVLFEGSTHGILAMDMETGRFGYVNPSICRMLGYSERELLQLGIADIHPKDSLDQVMVEFESLVRNEKNLSAAIPCRRKDGTVFYADIASAQSFIQGRRHAVGFFMDVSERRRAEEALREREAILRTLIEANPESLFLLDTRGVILAASQVAAQRLEKTLEEIIGTDAFALIPPEVGRKRFEIFQQVLATGTPERFEDVREDFCLDISMTPISRQGEVVQVAVLAVDQTLKIQAEEALRESEARFRMLFEYAPDAYILADSQGEIIDCNQATEKLAGYGREELVGNNFACLPWLDFRQQVKLADLLAQTARGEVLGPVDFTVVRKDGGEVIAEGMNLPLLIQGQNLVLTIVRDITARKKAEAALRESETRFRHISSTISDISYSCRITPDGAYAIDWMAGAAERITGYSVEEIKAHNCWQFLVIEADRPLFEKHVRGLAVGSSGACELRLRHKNGGSVWVASFAEFVQEPGQPGFLHLYGGMVDITARKQAEEALKESEARYRALFDASPDAITVMDMELNFVMANRRGLEIWGVEGQEQAGSARPAMKYIAPEDRPRVMAAMQELLTTGRTQTFEATMLKRDGQRFLSLNSAALIRDATGRSLAIIGVARDITALKQAEAELWESERRFRLMAETIQDVFWIAAPGMGKTVYVSPGYEYIWGQTREALYHNPKLFLETVHPEDRERVKAEIVAARVRSIPWSHEYRIIRPDGTVRWIQNRGFPIRDDQDSVTRFTGVATDITEQKALEQQLLQAQKMEAVGRLAGGIAHDFNNLLMAITGYGELMRSKVLKDDPLYSHLENILKAGDRAAALTQQLLTFSRQKIVHPQVVDLNRVVLDLEPMLRRLIGEDLDLEVVTDRRPGSVRADPGQLGQIIMNLVVNARDAMPQGGRLTLKTAPVDFTVGCHNRFGLTPPGPYVRLEVRDTGVGIDEATQAHVFEPFFTTKEPGKGTGLGLSTVYGIVKQSGGYLDLESSPGSGSIFSIYLPRLEGIVEVPLVKTPITARFQGDETILLVEDEDVLRGLLAKFLRLYGYTVLEARHGGEALLACERHPGPIHLMVTDVVMPQMSGRELAERLSPLRSEMQIIYMSGYTEDALIQHGVADLSVAFLQKPFRPIELARRVRAVLHPAASR
jgi:two-component system, cell cycle sensor histidine kinase and response regulator CckA